jgi:hypothetical protein
LSFELSFDLWKSRGRMLELISTDLVIRCFPTFWVVGSRCTVPIKSTGTEVRCGPIKNLRMGPIPAALQLREASTTSPSMAPTMSTSAPRSSEAKVVHGHRHCLRMEYNHKPDMSFYFSLRSDFSSRQSLNPLSQNPSRSKLLKI